jgi:hypothetical protein
MSDHFLYIYNLLLLNIRLKFILNLEKERKKAMETKAVKNSSSNKNGENPHSGMLLYLFLTIKKVTLFVRV